MLDSSRALRSGELKVQRIVEKCSFLPLHSQFTLSKMGNSSSKQTAEDVPPQAEQTTPTTTTSDSNLETGQPLSEDSMQQDDSTAVQEDTQKEEQMTAVKDSAQTSTEDGGDSFKIPSLPTSSSVTSAPEQQPLSPNSTSLKALPADIEHILSLGADRDELSKLKTTTATSSGSGGGEIDQVVKELREKYQQEGNGSTGEGSGELSQVEKEMQEKGILRNQENIEQTEDKMDQE